MSNGVGLVLLAVVVGMIAVGFETYGIDTKVMAFALMAVGAGGLMLWLLQPVTRWSLHHLVPRDGQHDTADSAILNRQSMN